MKSLAEWRESKRKIEIKEVYDIAVQIILQMQAKDSEFIRNRISPFSIGIKENNDIFFDENMNSKAYHQYCADMEDFYLCSKSINIHSNDFICNFEIGLLIYYLVTEEEYWNTKLPGWKNRLRNSIKIDEGDVRFLNEADGELILQEADEELLRLIKGMLMFEKNKALSTNEFMESIMMMYSPDISVSYYSDVTGEELWRDDSPDIGRIEKSYDYCIQYNDLQRVENVEYEKSVNNTLNEKFPFQIRKSAIKHYIHPKRWKIVNKEIEAYNSQVIYPIPDSSSRRVKENIRKRMEGKKISIITYSEALDAYFEIYKVHAINAVIYLEEEGSMLCLFDNRDGRKEVEALNFKITKNAVGEIVIDKAFCQRVWNEIEDRFSFIDVSLNDVDMYYVAGKLSLDTMIRKEVIEKHIMNKETPIFYSDNGREIEIGAEHFIEMRRNLGKYFDLCLWSRDVFGKNVAQILLPAGEQSCEKEIKRVVLLENNTERVYFVFFYKLPSKEHFFSYGENQRKAFTVAVSREELDSENTEIIINIKRQEAYDLSINLFHEKAGERKTIKSEVDW